MLADGKTRSLHSSLGFHTTYGVEKFFFERGKLTEYERFVPFEEFVENKYSKKGSHS